VGEREIESVMLNLVLRMTLRPAARVVVGLALLALLVLPGCAVASSGTSKRDCQPVTIPVALQPGQPTQYVIWGELCLPHGPTPRTVQLLVHGGTYNHAYWDFGTIDGIDYSYVDAALAGGYAVLAIDRLGDGQSSHPPSTDLTFPNTIYTLHEVIQALRSGQLGVGFSHVLYVGHSFGSAYGVDEIATYGDVDAAILTGYGHTDSPSFAALGNADSYPAVDDPRFSGSGLDPGYLTTKPGDRVALYYYAPGADPNVIAQDEATKDTIGLSELITRPKTYLLTPQIHVPVLILDGQHDVHYCAADDDDCSTQSIFYQEESPYFTPAACLQTFLVPNTGHVVALSLSAPLTDAVMLAWSEYNLSPTGSQGPCLGSGPL
jgi:pimeloyl-ACP methyl ester carboxylesterase